VLGAVVAGVLWLASYRAPTLGAAIALVTWVWLTGALHLDGLADLSDALAAAHHDQQRFFAVLADPHLGTFGVVSIVLVLILKLTSLAHLTGLPQANPAALPLLLAWARLGPLAWSRWLRPLKAGQGERFAAHRPIGWIVAWTAVLLVASALLSPMLCLAPLVIAAWGAWLRWRLGGITGDCLGAGVEITEVVLLGALALSASGT
jgi:adenosylcobinamide-GDP ribazoletransferase